MKPPLLLLVAISILFSLELLCGRFGTSFVVSAVPVVSTEYDNDTYHWRLVDGHSEFEGRLEVRRNDSEWGTVDSYGWNSDEVSVACAMFGYSHGLSPDRSGISFGNGHLPIILSSVSCDGTEESLLHCQRSEFGLGPSSFFASNTVGLFCLPSNTSLKIRFDPKENEFEHGGAFHVYDGVQRWGEICAHVWNIDDAHTACKQLGYPSALLIMSYTHDVNRDYLLTQLSCPRNGVNNLAECTYYGFDECRCFGHKKAGAICNTYDTDVIDMERVEYRLDKLIDDTFYEAGVILGRLPGEQEYRTMCFEEQRMDSGAYSVAEAMCMNVEGEQISSFQVIGPADEKDPRFATSRRSILVGNVVTYPSLDLDNVKAVDGPCSKYGYISIHTICQHTINYKTLPVSLSPMESCMDRCGYHPGNINCRCDPECEALNDCCLDYQDVCTSTGTQHINTPPATDTDAANGNHTTALIAHDDYSCLTTSTDILESEVIKSCPGESRYFLFIRYKCENEPATDDPLSSILQRWPVFDKDGQNFRNIFCAICNGKHHLDYELWSVNAPIPTLHTNLGGFLPWGLGKRRRRRRRRQTADPCSSDTDGQQLHDQTTDIRVGMKLRFCEHGVVDTCPPDYPFIEVAEACQEYSSHRCGYDYTFSTYKNPHCMVCNDQEEQKYYHSCNPTKNFAQSAFTDLYWEFSDTSENENKAALECSLNFNTILDPTSGECEYLDCPAGYALDDSGQCIFRHELTDIRDGVNCALKDTHLIFAGKNIGIRETTVDCVIDKFLNDHPSLGQSEYPEFVTSHLKWNANDQAIWGVTLSAQDVVGEDMIHRFVDKMALNSTLADVFQLTCSVTYMEVVHTCKKYDVVDKCAFNWHRGNADEFKRTDATSLTEVYKFHDRYIIPDFLFVHSSLSFDIDSNMFSRNDDILVCGSSFVPLVNDCRLLTIGEDQFTIESLDTVLVHNGIEYESGEYILIPDGRAQVCEKPSLPVVPEQPTQESNSSSYKFMNLDGFIIKTAYMTGTLISLVGHIGTIGIYLVISDLLDYHGRAILCVVISIFVGQLVLLLTKLLHMGSLFCLILSITSHYAWLAAFNWMNVLISQLAYHFAFLKMSASDDVSTCGEVVTTNLAGWGIPIVVVAVTGVLHMLDPVGEINIKYGGDDICWIQGAVSDLLAFGVPVATTIAYCTAMYLMTRRFLFKARQEATDLRGGMDWADGLCKLRQFMSIGTMVALTWILAYLAVHINTVGFWSIFICCNSALGVIIFGYVVTNQRTKDAWRIQFGKKQNIQDSSINKFKSGNKKKTGIDGKPHTHNITTPYSTGIETLSVSSGAAADESDENNESVPDESDQTNKSVPEKTDVDDDAPLNDDIGKESVEIGMEASGGVVNNGAEF